MSFPNYRSNVHTNLCILPQTCRPESPIIECNIMFQLEHCYVIILIDAVVPGMRRYCFDFYVNRLRIVSATSEVNCAQADQGGSLKNNYSELTGF